MMNPNQLSQFIDHTLLRPEAKREEIEKVCHEAIDNQFMTVCVELKWLELVSDILKGSSVKPIAVVCFPQGTASTAEKVKSTAEAVKLGPKEIDMVLNRELLKQRRYLEVLKDIEGVVIAASGYPVKVILETSELSNEEKAIACALSKIAGASFVKTSTGFSKGGATVEDVKLMRNVVGPEMGVKASGGIRSYEDAVKMIEAGANRLGTSASVAIVQGAKGNSGY